MKRLVQIAMVSVFLLAVVSSAVAQQTLQPVVRLGNYIEVGNDLFMHIIATTDARYKIAQNQDFEKRIRDQTTSRSPTSTAQHETEGDLFYAEVRFGADFRYQKNLTFQLLFENQSVFDGNLVDDRSNTSNPGGTDVFGRAAVTENPGFRVERFWTRYQFSGTPVSLLVGAILDGESQAGILGTDDPRIQLEAEFGDLTLWAKALVSRESSRIGLQNDNDHIYYIVGGAYDLKPHRFGADIVYFRDRFTGADTQAIGCDRADMGCTGQKIDSVWINASWTGRFGPIRSLLQGNILLGKADGAIGAALPAGVQGGQEYDIFASSGIAYVEADLGIVRPYVAFFIGSGDGNPRDRQLRGFQTQPESESTQAASGMMEHFDKMTGAGGGRDFSCPARARFVRTGAPASNPYAIGSDVLATGGGNTRTGAFAECAHTVSNIYNSRLGDASHVAIVTSYSNPGTLVIPVGLQVFPLKGHRINAWYTYRAMLDSTLLENAFVPEIQAGVIRKIRTPLYHDVGAYWMWTLNPHFDIRATGNLGFAAEGYRDLARLADCDPGPGRRTCQGQGTAVRGEVRFRARF
jgi:hypothetical protein